MRPLLGCSAIPPVVMGARFQLRDGYLDSLSQVPLGLGSFPHVHHTPGNQALPSSPALLRLGASYLTGGRAPLGSLGFRSLSTRVAWTPAEEAATGAYESRTSGGQAPPTLGLSPSVLQHKPSSLPHPPMEGGLQGLPESRERRERRF